MAPTDLLSAGSVFAGRFRVVELLGQGEMGATYAVDPLGGSARCALKVMSPALARGQAWRARFATEAMRTSTVASTHVLQTLDAGIDSATGRPWFTTELLRSEDLATRVSRDGPLPFADVRLLVIAVGDALGEAHAQGLVHYDLTPENVHLAPGSPFAVRLRELAISRLVSDACAAEGDQIGTAIWMPPEQFELGRMLSPAANSWSLGLLAFFAAVGAPYWMNASNESGPSKELLREILSDRLVPASERARALGRGSVLPRRFDAWFARCLMREPRERFDDAHAAYSAFHRIDRPDSVAPPPAVVPAAADDTFPVAALTSQAAVAAVAAPPAVSPTPPAAVTTVAAFPPVRRDAKRRGRGWLLVAFVAVSAAFGFWLWNDDSARQDEPTALTAPTPAASPAPALAPSPALPAASTTGAPSASAAAPPAAASSAVVFAEGALTTDAADELADFDLASALKALNRVYYGDCHPASPGVLAITFGSSGRVKKVAVVQGVYDDKTAGCMFARFGVATMSPFRGIPQTVTASIVATP
ncbi:MAG TPA: serine/threonine-protein kinase [Polyangiaceae bacterium]